MVSDQSPVGFIERLPSDNCAILEIACVVNLLGQVGDSINEVVLEVVLDVLPVDDAIGGKVASRKER